MKRGITFVRRRSSTNARSRRLVVRTALRWMAGSWRWASDASKIILKARDSPAVFVTVLLHKLVCQLAPSGPVGRVPDAAEERFDLAMSFCGDLIEDVAHLMGPATDADGLAPHFFHSTGETRCPVCGHRQGRRKATVDQVRQEGLPNAVRFAAGHVHVD